MFMDLDNRCSKIHAMVYQARSDLNFYEFIGKHAKQINEKKYAHFFGSIQRMAHRCVILSLCNIYEQETGRTELLSIPALCRSILKDGILQDRNRLEKGLSEIDIHLLGPLCEHRTDQQIIKEVAEEILYQIDLKHFDKINFSKMIKKIRSGLMKAKKVRDKLIAHPEKVDVAKQFFGPSIDEMDAMLNWPEKFIAFVWSNFTNLSVNAYPNKDAERTTNSLTRIMQDLTIIEKSIRAN